MLEPSGQLSDLQLFPTHLLPATVEAEKQIAISEWRLTLTLPMTPELTGRF